MDVISPLMVTMTSNQKVVLYYFMLELKSFAFEIFRIVEAP